MKLRYKIAGALLLILATTLIASMFALSYNSPCETPSPLPAHASWMKAAVHRCYGSPDVIRLENVPKPGPRDNEVLVRIHAASVNPVDWHLLRGEPNFMRVGGGLGSPSDVQLGVDYAGTVEAVGRNVTRFKPGDEVFGGTGRGTLSEYVSVSVNGAIVPKPANISFEQAAAVPVAAVTALQALRDEGRIHAGQKVLINGASGGVGTFAVQLARVFGADVTGVCSTKNVEMVRSLGADRVVDYTREDILRSGERYDLIVDNVGNHSLLEYRRIMQPNGILVIVGGPAGEWVGPLVSPIKAMIASPFVSQQVGMFIARLNRDDLRFLADLMQSGKLTPIIDKRFSLQNVPEAVRYLEQGHARGKVVIDIQ